MTCTHCGHASLSMQYTLRFAPENGRAKKMNLHLCTSCLNELSNAPDVELVGDTHLGAVNPSGR